ncbi:quinon protein alcohol dehydrogenase-like superfamily [Aspergillus ambiguus]|uniref:WD40 repeat domain-containing protein n=1 Tax=Aspergillus ambiguus TaxID=176160 RepID=UPI003CCDA8C2
MAYNSLSVKSKSAGSGSSLRITPSNSPTIRPPPRTPNRAPQYQSTLALRTVIGTTTTTPNGFCSHDQSRSFALCAGSAAVLAELDDDHNVTQRFFRARPSVPSVHPITSFYNPSTPPITPNTRKKSFSGIKPSTNGVSYSGSPSNESVDNTTPRAWSSRERVKAVTSVAISPNGRFLAVGETGYNPRVLIFSTAKDAPQDVPLSILAEHTFGVRSLSFSSNSQYLATLGDVNDGFLFVWNINLKNGAAKLHSTNKCTSFIHEMCWMGQTLITAGVRHVKVWRLPDVNAGSPSKSRPNGELAPGTPTTAPKALSGRNCLLGTLAENTFTSVASISDQEAVLGTDTGALCFLDDNESSQKLSVVQNLGFGITSLAVDSDRSCIWIGGRGQQMKRVSMEELRPHTKMGPVENRRLPTPESKIKGSAITCMGSLTSHLVAVDSTKAIHIYPMDALASSDQQDPSGITLSAHRDAVLGIRSLAQPNAWDADFFTWSCKGTVNFWDLDGKCHDSKVVTLEQIAGNDSDHLNELKVLRATECKDLFVSGDKFGVLRVLKGRSLECVNVVRAHGGEITDIALHSTGETSIIASGGRDRMVQLFQRDRENLQLIQTMDDHVGAIGQLLFVNNGQRLLSCSADRTIIVRERVTREESGSTVVAYMISKVITVKASPVSMALSTEDTESIAVSTVDRCIQQYEIVSGRNLQSFRALDSESNDTVVMGALTVADETPGQSPRLLIGVSGTDKSIRVYDLARGVLLTGEFGHTEGVSDVCLLESRRGPPGKITRTLVSSGMDGVVMIWDVLVQPQQQPESVQTAAKEDEVLSKESPLSQPPLRKILSRNELAGFRQDNSATTPTSMREHSPPLVRKFSKLSLESNSGSPVPSTPPSTSTRPSPLSGSRLARFHETPSPASSTPTPVKRSSNPNNVRRSSLDFRSHRTRNAGKSEFGSLDMSTEQVCRTLKAYRKKLNGSTEHLHSQKELERELGLTLRVLGSRNLKCEHTRGEVEETDSSGKENEADKVVSVPPVTDDNVHLVKHRTPSTPNLRYKNFSRPTRRPSLDVTGEG